MDINYLGESSFKIKGKTATLVVDPIKTVEADILVPGSIVPGPGEYELKGISILGFKFNESVIYVFEVDGFRLCHLGKTDKNLTDALVEDLGDIDVLMISPGNSAGEIIRNIEPTIVIPMNYEDPEAFIKEIGMTVERLPKLTLKKEELAENQKVVVLDRK